MEASPMSPGEGCLGSVSSSYEGNTVVLLKLEVVQLGVLGHVLIKFWATILDSMLELVSITVSLIEEMDENTGEVPILQWLMSFTDVPEKLVWVNKLAE